MKIICVNHNEKVSAKIPIDTIGWTDEAMPITVYSKPDSCLLSDGKAFYIPDFSDQIYCNTSIVVKINKQGKNIAVRFAHRYYDEISVGLNLSAHIDGSEASAAADLYKIFDNSSITGVFVSKDIISKEGNGNVQFLIDNITQNAVELSDFYLFADRCIAYISKFITLKTGDLIFFTINNSCKQIHINNHIIGTIGKLQLLDLHIL